VDGEALDLDERWKRRVADATKPHGQAVPSHGYRREQVHAERRQLDVTIEPIFERCNDERPERRGPRAQRRRDRDDYERTDDRDRQPAAICFMDSVKAQAQGSRLRKSLIRRAEGSPEP
jgi:hypothetical protein